MRHVAAALLAMSVLVAPGASGQTPPRPFDETAYTHAQRLVTVAPGRRLNLYCTGTGTPSVILEAGWGGPTTSWRYIQPVIAKITRVCSYDRAGQGFSDGGPLPRDADAIVSDLHALLRAGGVAPPHILVGHSLGGLSMLLYADRHPSELAGMLLVDPAFAHQARAMRTIPGLARIMAGIVPSLAPCRDLAARHVLPTDPALVALCLEHDAGYGPALTAATDRSALRPERWTDSESELDSFEALPTPGRVDRDRDSTELDAAARPLGALDLVVLTAGIGQTLPGMSSAQIAAMAAVWKHGHDLIAARSTRGVNIVVPDTHHYIQFEQPDAVIRQITTLVEDARRTHG